ncbi:hypothetical protein MUK42_07870 [Musa troglodytarum]|uniref:Uncharacterized protein n=1 Tax=Musa troglodytarum TaxID=320322 RepID=A0A9E7KSH6_9LILI|nr:hypothetical protein MUK42_07870 [Musa troglodytarum]
MPRVGCTFLRHLTTYNCNVATARIGSRRDTTGESSFLSRLRGTKRNGVPAASPSSMDVGGGELVITTEEFKAFLRRCEQMHGTDDPFFTDLLAPVMTPPESHLSSVDSVAPNEAVVPPSSTDVGGGELVITVEEFKESHLSSIDSVALNEVGVPTATPSSTDVGGGELVTTVEKFEAFLHWCEQMYGTDDRFLPSLEQVDDTISFI